MKTKIQEKFENLKKKEITLRRTTILLAIIPFVIGSVWMYYAYTKVQQIDKQYKSIKEKVKTEEINYGKLVFKKRDLELELLKSYGFSLDRKINTSSKDININNCIKANDAIKTLESNYKTANNINIWYYYKSIDDQKIALYLKSMGFSIEQKKPSVYLQNQKTNCIWFGNKVAINDCKIVALTLIRAGIPIKAIRSYKNSEVNPLFKKNIIEIGGDKSLEKKSINSLSVDYILNASSFPRDIN